MALKLYFSHKGSIDDGEDVINLKNTLSGIAFLGVLHCNTEKFVGIVGISFLKQQEGKLPERDVFAYGRLQVGDRRDKEVFFLLFGIAEFLVC